MKEDNSSNSDNENVIIEDETNANSHCPLY